MMLLKNAYDISLHVVNSGMELYTIRLIVGIMRKMVQIPDSQLILIDEDFKFLKILIERLEKVCRFFPL